MIFIIIIIVLLINDFIFIIKIWFNKAIIFLIYITPFNIKTLILNLRTSFISNFTVKLILFIIILILNVFF